MVKFHLSCEFEKIKHGLYNLVVSLISEGNTPLKFEGISKEFGVAVGFTGDIRIFKYHTDGNIGYNLKNVETWKYTLGSPDFDCGCTEYSKRKKKFKHCFVVHQIIEKLLKKGPGGHKIFRMRKLKYDLDLEFVEDICKGYLSRFKKGTICNYCFKICEEEVGGNCFACKSVRYCSRRCQKDDWKNHKKTCKKH